MTADAIERHKPETDLLIEKILGMNLAKGISVLVIEPWEGRAYYGVFDEFVTDKRREIRYWLSFLGKEREALTITQIKDVKIVDSVEIVRLLSYYQVCAGAAKENLFLTPLEKLNSKG